jgi:hypothetical protein
MGIRIIGGPNDSFRYLGSFQCDLWRAEGANSRGENIAYCSLAEIGKYRNHLKRKMGKAAYPATS